MLRISKESLLQKRAGARRRSEDRDPLIPRSELYRLFMQAPAIIAVLRGPQHMFELVNPAYQRLFEGRRLLGRSIREALPEIEGQGFFEVLDRVYATGESYVAREARVMLDGEHFFNFIYQPILSEENKSKGIVVFAFDVTADVLARRQGEERLRES